MRRVLARSRCTLALTGELREDAAVNARSDRYLLGSAPRNEDLTPRAILPTGAGNAAGAVEHPVSDPRVVGAAPIGGDLALAPTQARSLLADAAGALDARIADDEASR